MSITNPTLDELLSSPIGSKWSTSGSRTSYTPEIQQMMYAFGDYERPLYESAQLVEHIVHQQMTSLLLMANQVAHTRGSRVVGVEELLFLMRTDRQKLSRLVKHLSAKDSSQRLDNEVKYGSVDDEETHDCTRSGGTEADCDLNSVLNNSSNDEMTPKPPQQTKRVKLCYDFLSSIDSMGTLLAVFDDNFVDTIKLERNLKTDRLTTTMPESEYPRFSEARRTSFANKSRPSKFRDWLLKESSAELKPNPLALEVFQYLAKETVSQIVDLSLLVKQDLERDVCDPLTSVMAHKLLRQDLPLGPTSGQMSDSDEPMTAYSSPNSPFFASSQPKTPSLMSPIEGPKSKKRKRNDNSKLMFEAHSHCITPNHIREAIRRYYTVSGPFAKSSSFATVGNKLLAL